MERTLSYYEVLDIPLRAPAGSVKKAYVNKLNEYSEARYEKEFKQVAEAYRILSDPALRRAYDEELSAGPSYESLKMREKYFFEQRFEKAWIKFKVKEYEEALEILEEYEAILPGEEEVELLMADCYLRIDRLEEAEEKIVRAMPEGKDEKAWLYLMLRLRFRKGEYEEARPYGLRLLSLEPSNPQYIWKYAQTYTWDEDFYSAARLADDYFSSHPLDMESMELMILLILSSGYAGDVSTYEKSKKALVNFSGKTTDDHRKRILDELKREMEMMAPAHYLYSDLLNLISEINGGEARETEEWLRTAGAKKMKKVHYYPDARARVLSPGERTGQRALGEVVRMPENGAIGVRGPKAERGSARWSILFGILTALFLHPFIGVMSGTLWYYRGGKIKAQWDGLGFAIFVTFYIFLLLIKLADT